MEKGKAVNFIIVSVYVFAFIAALVFAAPIIFKIILPFVLAYLISFMITPLSDILYQRCKIPKRIAIVVLMLIIISVLILLIFNFIYQAVFAMQGLMQTLPDIFNGKIPPWASGIYKFYLNLPTSKQIFIDEIFVNIKNNISEIVKSAAAVTFDAAKGIALSVPKIFIFTAVVILATYFICVDRKKIESALALIMPKNVRRFVSGSKKCLKRAVGGYINAQLILMCITFVILFSGLLIVRTKYAFLMAVFTAFVDALPIFGSGTVLIPWAVIKLMSGDFVRAAYLFALYILVMITRQLSEPKIVGNKLGINPLFTLFAMFAGYKTANFLGLILGPVAALIISEFLKEKEKFRKV